MTSRPECWMNTHQTKWFVNGWNNNGEGKCQPYLKYVRLEEDTFFFANALAWDVRDHETAVVSGNAVSAAFVKILDGRVRVEGYSITLGLGPARDDEWFIAEKLGLKVASD
ncbi:hypothetical protein LCGC14_0143300 [marine sediment metagenome]|uniref:Uncharacterized protein n=1 Tax=marine sediment metagenome TaxID=412755 RepID=A0A0F9XIM8_9ZZZZ